MASAADDKPYDRNRPFKRVNNDAFIPKDPPDGNGVACGCHTPEQFGKPDKEFMEFLKAKIPFFNEILGTVRQVLDTAGNIAAIIAAIEAAVIPLLTALGVAIPALGAIIGVLAAAAAATAAARKIIDMIMKGIESALEAFFVEILGERVMNRAIRVIPQWVPVVKGASNSKIDASQIREVEGICTRSFANPIDVPFYNWHYWFAWNIEVAPEPTYTGVISAAGNPGGLHRGFQIQWDPGFYCSDVEPYMRGFPDHQIPSNEGPVTNNDIMWPMTGMYVWAAGRWVYDCSRVSGNPPRMHSMIHPAKALATARWAAHSFEENDNIPVPAIEFMFVASKRGGDDPGGSQQVPYIGYESLNDTDYEFIIDLPEGPGKEVISFDIAHSGNVGANTIVVRPRLLMDVRQLPGIRGASIEPIVEMIAPEVEGEPPKQVRVKVPLTSLDNHATACGFNLCLGWADPAREEARKVRTCTVQLLDFSGSLQTRDSPAQKLRKIFKDNENKLMRIVREKIGNIEILNVPIPGTKQRIILHLKDIPGLGPLIDELISKALTALIDAIIGLMPAGSEEWLLHVGVNGTWRSQFFPDMKGSPAPSEIDAMYQKFVFHLSLAEGDKLFYSSHGAEFDPVGDIMHSSRRNRIFEDGLDQPVSWSDIADPGIDKQKQRALVFEYVAKIMTDTSGGVTNLALGFDNSPLGIIDPDLSDGTTDPASNPRIVKNLGRDNIVKTATFAYAEGDQMKLFEEPGKPDYRLTFQINVENKNI